MRKYDFNDVSKFGGATQSDYETLRIAYITHVDSSRGTVDIKWLDHPGDRSGVQINQSALGTWDFPVVGSTVLIKMRNDIPEIIRYIPLNYAKQVSAGHAEQLYPGEKLLMSYQSAPVINGNSLPQLVPTGTQIKMDNSGRIIMSTGSGDKFLIDPVDHLIEINSMDHKISTEAGILEFGVAEREIPSTLDPTQKEKVTIFKNVLTGQAYTEFHLRLLDVSDDNPLTPPEVDNPFIELILGTALKQEGDTFVPDRVPSSDPGAGKEIAISLSVKDKTTTTSPVVFLFRVDKAGNVKMEVAGNCTLKCNDIKLGGAGNEQPIVLKDFLSSVYNSFISLYNSHPHIGNLGLPTGSPLVQSSPASLEYPNITTKTQAE